MFGSDVEVCVNAGCWLSMRKVSVLRGEETVFDVSLAFIASFIFSVAGGVGTLVVGYGLSLLSSGGVLSLVSGVFFRESFCVLLIVFCPMFVHCVGCIVGSRLLFLYLLLFFRCGCCCCSFASK